MISNVMDVKQIDHLLKNTTLPWLNFFGEVKDCLMDLNRRKATESDDSRLAA